MPHGHAYPGDLADYVLEQWPKHMPLRFSRAVLCEVLSIAYQASLTVEEGRPTRFRLLLTDPERLPARGAPREGAMRLRFDRSRPLTAEELRRLSPAAPFESALIGAHASNGKLEIWGLAHSGPAWLAPSWGGRMTVPVWTVDPIVHVTGPGRVAVRCAGKLVGAVERGSLADTTLDVFESEWLHRLFADTGDELQRDHAASHPDQSLLRTVSQHMLRRSIQLIRGARHGGMLLFVSDRSESALRLKYRFEHSEPTMRFRTLIAQLLRRTSERSALSWLEFVADDDPQLTRIEESIFEISRLIASLSAIDGAVVIDKRYEVLGFGAEVSAEVPAPTRVYQALDVEGETTRPELVESVGTRHRAAYRFAREHPGGLAIVISHDGAVRFVTCRDGEVVFWEQSVSP